MQLPKDKSKYLAQFRYVELGRYVPSVNKLIREKIGDEALLVDIDEVSLYAEKNANTGIYTSVFQYQATEIGGLALGPIYFDLDGDPVESARQDATRLLEYLCRYIPREGIRLYYTGSKGFHLECEPIVVGVTPSSNLSTIFRHIATQIKQTLELTTIDFAVYDKRRMWRLPNSKHQLSRAYKCELSDDIFNKSITEIQEYCRTPHPIQDHDLVFNLSANEWYRGFTYEVEEVKTKKYTQADILERFEKHGSTKSIDGYQNRVFDPVKLFEGCPSILRLWNKAEAEHNLNHEERLFLCSILTYTDEAVGYLHAILSCCDDYNFEITQSHIDDWIARREKGIGGKPYSCARANSVGAGCMTCELEPKPSYYKMGDKLYPGDTYAAPSPIRFAYSRQQSNTYKKGNR